MTTTPSPITKSKSRQSSTLSSAAVGNPYHEDNRPMSGEIIHYCSFCFVLSCIVICILIKDLTFPFLIKDLTLRIEQEGIVVMIVYMLKKDSDDGILMTVHQH
jgi:hypothetical protein